MAFALLFSVVSSSKAQGPIEPWPENPWYWSVDDKPVLLIGGSDDDNLFQWPEEELIPQLDRIQSSGGNVVRNTMSDRRDRGWEVYPYHKLADGRYDLNEWNEEYWRRFETFLRETRNRNIFVQIEVWDRFDYTDRNGAGNWQRHPLNPVNNINYTIKESGFAESYPDHPGQNRQPFFFTTPIQRDNRTVLAIQRRFVNRMLDQTLKYDHVMYCVDNETNGEEAWSLYWATFIKARAAREEKKVFVTEMWDDWNLLDEEHRRTFDHPRLYDFVDVSQNTHNSGELNWRNFLSVRKRLGVEPRPMNTTKIYGADGNTFGDADQDAIERFWRHLLAGAASVRFHRPPAGLGIGEKAAACVRAAGDVANRVPMWTIQPANHLLSDRSPNEAFLAADPGESYVLYFPAAGSVSVNLGKVRGKFLLRWTSVASEPAPPDVWIDGRTRVRIEPPSESGWIATLVRE